MSSNASDTVWRSEKWRKLSRRDLMAFDTGATETVLTAMERGGTGRISSKGHAILRAPNGKTMAVGPKSNKSQQVNAIRIRKLFPEAATTSNGNEVMPNTTTEDEAITPAVPEATIPCTNKRCDQAFATQGALYSHIHKDHKVCPEPGCNYAADSMRQITPHHRIVHLGLAPRRMAKEAGKSEDKRGRSLASVPTGTTTTADEPKPTKAKKKDRRLTGGFANMTTEQRRENARKGANKRWANARAAQAAAQESTPPVQEPAEAPVGDHTPEGVAEPTGPHSVPTITPAELARQHKAPEPEPYGPRLVKRMEELTAAWASLADFDSNVTEAIRRLDDWVTVERIRRDERIAELEAEVGELRAKFSLLKEALDA